MFPHYWTSIDRPHHTRTYQIKCYPKLYNFPNQCFMSNSILTIMEEQSRTFLVVSRVCSSHKMNKWVKRINLPQ